MSVRLSCPSCNTGFLLGTLPPDRRAACPRCGDVFPVRGEAAAPEAEEQQTDATAEAKPVTPAPPGRTLPRLVLLAGVLVIACAAGLAAYLSREPKSNPDAPPALPQPATAPTQLAAVGYLPADCNVVFALRPGPLLESAARTKLEPRELLGRAGLPAQPMAALEQIGLPLADIDHIAAGLYLPDPGDAEVRVALVLVLNRPLADEDEFRGRLKAKPVAGKPGRWTVALTGVPLAPVLARVSPTVWAFGLNDRDLAAVERGGYGPGGVQFREAAAQDGRELRGGVRGMMRSVPPAAAVWLVADDDRDWTAKPLVALAGRSQELNKWLPVLKAGRGCAVALSFGEHPRFNVLVRTADTQTAKQVRAYFAARAAEVETAASTDRGDTFAEFDAPLDPATLAPTLRRFATDAAK
jgi:hypothetical protein